MLLRFGVTNHRSLRDRQELSLVASSLDDDASGLMTCRHVPGHRVLPAVVIYGANASGKSNLVHAIRWMRSAVLQSQTQGEPGGSVPQEPFLLDPTFGSMPSQFEIDFVIDNVRYHYGFKATASAFTAEWLFAFPNERRQMLFERDGMQFKFSRNLKGRNHIISELTRTNSLFLSAAAQNGHEELGKLSRYFRNIAAAREVLLHESPPDIEGNAINTKIIQFLKAAGTGVVDYRIIDRDPSQKHLEIQAKVRVLLSKFITESEDFLKFRYKATSIELAHQSTGAEPVYFELGLESEGTRRLLRLLGPVFRALEDGAVMVVDELDASLHTHACELVIALFSSPGTNPNGAQLIATTHDTNLLSSAHLRRDQVWLTEKDPAGATHLYPLTDFRTRKDDNLERGYLQGRYGAIPFSGRPSDLLATL